ncbi:uridylate-specific endoribonuclease A [Anguilla rostrata]|uniref:uridylate-specific endoribonuclease A n=1 Tax=Anguilla rostrata TaxID=7938 RepID=UPI0030D2DACC
MKIILLLFLGVTLFSLGQGNTLDSCQRRCGYGTDSAYTCQCNSACERFGDCCSDYYTLCKGSTSCKGRCGERYDYQDQCHCNSKCSQYNNCCNDYSQHCGGSSGGAAISDSELKTLSELLYALDSNKASPFELEIDTQARVSDSQTSSRKDLSPRPLFSYLDSSLFSKPTFAAFLALLDNYQRYTGQTERFSSAQLAEQDTFLREAISNTEIGQELYTFFHSKGFYSSEAEFIYDLKMMWFGLYSRNNNAKDSSGFEHIFAGEVKNGKVSGFHSWIQFYRLEKKGLMNYYSHSFDGPWTTFPDILGMQFNWDGYFKQVGSAIIGSSPEFDFALYSLCYIARPGKQCHLSLGGKTLVIQTYTWDNSYYGDGKKFIASGFPATPRALLLHPSILNSEDE